jgi:hypothetical protein
MRSHSRTRGGLPLLSSDGPGTVTSFPHTRGSAVDIGGFGRAIGLFPRLRGFATFNMFGISMRSNYVVLALAGILAS